jgi:hypothetical protein
VLASSPEQFRPNPNTASNQKKGWQSPALFFTSEGRVRPAGVFWVRKGFSDQSEYTVDFDAILPIINPIMSLTDRSLWYNTVIIHPPGE